MNVKSNQGKSNVGVILLIVVLIAIIIGLSFYIMNEKGVFDKKTSDNNEVSKNEEIIKVDETQGKEGEKLSSEYEITGNGLGKFDLEFLKLENGQENKIYSPLSIKYALSMLNEGAGGNSKKQIESVIGNYIPKKYHNSENISFANAFFIKDTFKDNIKSDFSDNLKDKYNADVIYDSFGTAHNINSWISDKTLKLIDNALSDSDVTDLNFALVNALAIDMEWENKFLENGIVSTVYNHEKFGWSAPENLVQGNFEGVDNKISGMQIMSSINKYDIVNSIGEDNIRRDVGEAFRAHLEKNPDSYFMNEYSDIDSAVQGYLDEYIKEINGNYKDLTTNVEYSFYVDDDVKAFRKDLKKYDDVTLQYVAIMPKKETLNSFVNNIDSDSVNNIISNLKELKLENFNDGVITAINGYIPKFKFDYELNLIEDLKRIGIQDIFDLEKANLEGITSQEAYIEEAVHKANIEFTQDGIKAAAATMVGGLGAGGEFDYYYDVPVEEIDLVFDNPYMFLIVDKDSGEVWFAGTVYEPLSLEDETEKDNYMLEKMGEFWINEGPTVAEDF